MNVKESIISSEDAVLIGIQGYNFIQTATGIAMSVDSQVVLPDEVWLVDSCSLISIDPNLTGTDITPPVGGIFICPSGTQSPLTSTVSAAIPVALAQAVQGFIPLPQVFNQQAALTPGNASTSVAQTTKTFIVQPNCFVRGIMFEGGAAPSIGSSLQLMMTVVRKKICQ